MRDVKDVGSALSATRSSAASVVIKQANDDEAVVKEVGDSSGALGATLGICLIANFVSFERIVPDQNSVVLFRRNSRY